MKVPAPLRIGNQTAFVARSLLEPFEFAVANAFTAFEFFPDRGFSGQGGWSEQDLSAEMRRSIQQTAAATDMQLSVHAPLEIDLLHDREDNRLYRTVEFAAGIGATLLNLHLDVGQGIERFVEALRPAILLTAEAGLRLALENTVWTGPEDFNRLFSTLEQVGDLLTTHVGMTLDLGHANLFAATRNDYWRYLDSLSASVPIIHLHLHENYGDCDSHLTLFTGPSKVDPAGIRGLLERLDERGFDGCAILEQWPQPPSLLVEAREKLLRLIQQRRESAQTLRP